MVRVPRWVARVAVPLLCSSLMAVFPLPPRPVSAAGPGQIAPAAGEGGVDATGRFATSVPIEVPAFRGLEPSLSLRYDSGSGNGFVGVGWTLTGVSFVERAAPMRGSPRYDGNDIFLLDGQELLPSCGTLGGTHCTRRQGFQRIRWDGPGNRWEVWDTDGTRSVYTSVYATPRGTFRWALTSEVDTHGNTVTYSYWRPPLGNAYLDTISYNGTVIKLWRESRAYPAGDPVGVANGDLVEYTDRRLKSIEIRTGGALVRAYKLSYQMAGSTHRSRLVSVQEFGRNATVDASGTVSGGTSLPPVTMGWQNGAARFTGTFADYSAGVWDSPQVKNLFGDVDGNGKADLVRPYPKAGAPAGHNAWVRVARSNGAGFPTSLATDVEVGGWNDATMPFLADVTGDGRADLLRIWACVGETRSCVQVNPSNGVSFPVGPSYEIGDWNPTEFKDYFADTDGDGDADLVRVYRKGGAPAGADQWVQINKYSSSSGFVNQSCNQVVGGYNSATMNHLADVNGDGRTDLLRVWHAGGGASVQVLLASPGGCFSLEDGNGVSYAVGGWDPATVRDHFVEVNGDGRADLVRLYRNGEDEYAQISLSTGAGYPTQNSNSSVGSWDLETRIDHLGDLDGDGRADLIRVYSNGGNAYALVRPYDGKKFSDNESFNARVGNDWNTGWPYHQADVSGDGKVDLVRIWNFGSGIAKAQVHLADGPVPDLLTSMSNGIGGTVGVAYTPSTQWWNDAADAIPTVFPTVASVTRDDGRTPSFAVQYTFADPRWARQASERRFLGYGSSTAFIDADGTRRETFYRQTLAGAGRVDRSYLKNSAGQVYSRDQQSYVETGSPPYVSQLASRLRYDCNLSSFCREAQEDYTYDTYSNVLTEVDRGDTFLIGDELTTATTYAPNTTSYVVSRPATITRHAGTSTAGQQLSRTVLFYDGAASSSTPPTKGDPTRVDAWNSTTDGYVSATAGHDTWGNVVSTTDPRGSTTTTTFDNMYHLFPTRSCNELNQCTDTTWDFVLGRSSSVTDPNGAVTGQTYDALGRLETRTDPAGGVSTWEYLDLGNPAQQRVRETRPDGSGDGLWSESYLDGLGRDYLTVREGPSTGTTYLQDRVYRSTTNLVWKESQWRQNGQSAVYTVTDHDGAGRPTRTTHPGGAFRTISYGSRPPSCESACPLVGFPTTTTTDELGHRRITLADPHGRLSTVEEVNGSSTYSTKYAYDPLGRLVKWTDAAGNISTVTYNSLGWKTSVSDMDTGTWMYAHDNGGLVTSQTDARNQTTTMAYDALGRRTSLTYPGGTQARWFFDEAGHGASTGRLTRVTYPAGSEDHTWNSRGLETATTQCIDTICKTTNMAHDSLGRLATLTYPDGEAVGHTYNPAGRLASVAGYVASMTWNAAGQLTAVSYPNGTSTSFSYDANRQWLTGSTVTGPGGATRYQAMYGYNAAGLVSSMTQATPTPATTTYTYDDLDRLQTVSGAQSQTFSYDAIGNTLSNSAVGAYVYDDPAHKHAVTAAGSATYTYDANGNLLTGDGRTLIWDGANRLASVTKAGTTEAFSYDAGERRLTKVSGANTTRYFGRHAEEVNGTLVKYYYAGSVLVARKQGTATVWYHADRLGSTRVLTDASGAEVRDYDYEAFGDLESITGTAANERDYTGHIRDAGSGLIYMNARYQDPKLGRFVSPDSVIPDLTNPQDLNRYSYVRNNPINNLDPNGRGPVPGCPDGCDWKNPPPEPEPPIGPVKGCPDGCNWKDPGSGAGGGSGSGGGKGGSGGGGGGSGSSGGGKKNNSDITSTRDDPAEHLRRVCRGDPDPNCAGTRTTVRPSPPLGGRQTTISQCLNVGQLSLGMVTIRQVCSVNFADEGEQGEQGEEGEEIELKPDDPIVVVDNGDGTVTVTYPDGTAETRPKYQPGTIQDEWQPPFKKPTTLPDDIAGFLAGNPLGGQGSR